VPRTDIADYNYGPTFKRVLLVEVFHSTIRSVGFHLPNEKLS
jgi:hypothetical protein